MSSITRVLPPRSVINLKTTLIHLEKLNVSNNLLLAPLTVLDVLTNIMSGNGEYGRITRLLQKF